MPIISNNKNNIIIVTEPIIIVPVEYILYALHNITYGHYTS